VGFTVQPAALRELGALLDRAREDVDSARAHLAGMESFTGGDGVLSVCLEGHQAAYRTLADWLGTLADRTLSATAEAIVESAAYYERTEGTAAANLDAAYPTADVAGARERSGYEPMESEGTARFADVTEPAEHVGAVKDYTDEMEGGALAWWDMISPSALLNQAIEGVSEVAVWLDLLEHSYNPYEELARKFVGDWAGVRAAADILRDVGRVVTDVALNLRWAAQGVDSVWRGNAADGAVVYLTELARRVDVDNAWPPIDRLATAYEEAAGKMVHLRDSAVGVLNSITDAAFQAAVACGIGGGAATTGVGVPVAALAALFAGYKINRVVDGIIQLIGLVNELNIVSSTLRSAQDGFTSISGPVLPALPAEPSNLPR
jgi:hypothetical protein